MRMIGFFFCLFLVSQPTLADTAQTQYSEKLQTLRNLEVKTKAAVNPTNKIVFPQVADGVFTGIKFVTSIVLSSNQSQTFNVTLTFTDGAGFPMTVSLFNSVTGSFLGTDSAFNLSIPDFESIFLETGGTGRSIGWATATSSPPESMGGVAAYQLIDNSSGQLLTIVGVGASAATPAFFVPVFKSTSLNSNTALAIANNSFGTAYLDLFLFGNDGSAQRQTITVGARQQLAKFVDEIFSLGSEFFGTLHFIRVDAAGEVDTQFDIHPVSLFLSNGILSSIPVTNLVAF